MHLTPLQLRSLKYYYNHRDHPPTFAEFIPQFALIIPIRGAIAALVAYAAFEIGHPIFAWLFIGAIAGATLRDMGNAFRATRTWPLLATVLDWNRVQTTAAEQGLAPYPRATSR